METRHISILGATGSIGLSTLDVIRRHPERFSVYALTASTRAEELAVARFIIPESQLDRERFERAVLFFDSSASRS